MPTQRLQLLTRAVPIAVGGVTASLLLAADPASLWRWRTAAAMGSAIAGVSGALLATRALGDRRRGANLGATSRDDNAPRASRAPARSSRPAEPADTPGVIVDRLREVRDACGGCEAVLWRVSATGDELRAAAWAAPTSEPDVPDDARVMQLIGWSARERLAQCVDDAAGATVCVAPVVCGTDLLGALSVHGVVAPEWARDEARCAAARHARQLGDLVELADARREYERQTHQGQSLLQAAQEFQRQRTVSELAAAVGDAALRVGSAQRVAVVRWDAQTGSGRVESSAGEDAVAVRQTVAEGSRVAAVCREGLPQSWEDGRLLDAETPVFGPGEADRQVGSLSVVPLHGRRDVIGAVVLEDSSPGAIRADDVRGVKLLAALAAVSFETLGDFEAAERNANTDQLTGLPNRRAFEAEFGPALDRADRFGEPVALVVCDVDHFKAVNDAHGHEAGDAVLQALGAILQRGVRTVDVCARFGGEEFVVLLPRTGRLGATEVAERLRQAIERRPVHVNRRELRVTASFGVAIYPATVTSRDDLFAAADRALYQAKRDGRNCVRCADATAVLD